MRINDIKNLISLITELEAVKESITSEKAFLKEMGINPERAVKIATSIVQNKSLELRSKTKELLNDLDDVIL